MAKFQLISETPITVAEMKEELEKIKKRDNELNFRAGKTEDYLNIYQGLDAKKSKELVHAIQKLDIPRLKETHIVKIVDLMPASAEELKSILSGYTITVSGDSLKKIMGVIEEHTPKKKKKEE